VLVRTVTAPADLVDLRELQLPTADGTIELPDVATVTQATTPPSISHTDGSRSAQITARPIADDLGAVTAALQAKLSGLILPAGATAEIGGVSANQSDAFTQLGLALLVAIAVVYMVMVVTFRSLLQPLVLLVAIPFAATGALGLLLLTDTPLDVPALIGMLMLVGIVVTNAIVLIDRVNQYRRDGHELFDAVVEGAAQRLRPILMTAVATVFALLPMAFGLTGGGVFISQPLAIVVIGGLISSTLLTLVLVPVLYLLAERKRGRHRQRTADELGTQQRLRGDGADQAGLVPHDHELSPVPGVELGQQPADVRLDSPPAQVQMVLDLAVGQPARDEGEHLTLPVGDAGQGTSRTPGGLRVPNELGDQPPGNGRRE
jgi:hydrophobic/amphiphilic exporter-1 (mainly G- bacteria), HAE1 family